MPAEKRTLRSYAKELRRKQTDAERVLWIRKGRLEIDHQHGRPRSRLDAGRAVPDLRVLILPFAAHDRQAALPAFVAFTARAGAEGRAVSFCSEEELEFLREIEKTIRMAIPKWEGHDWHNESLAERHARGKSANGARPSSAKQSAGGGRSGRRRGRR